MNTPAFLRQNAELISLVVLLVVAFLLKNIDTTALISAQTDRLKTASESAAANYTKGGIIAQPNTTPRAVSSANAAASISHAIESSLRPKVVPLPNFSAINDVKTKKIKFFNYLNQLSNTANEKVVQIRTEIQRMNPQRLTQQQAKRLNRLSKSHKIKTKVPAEQIDLLLRKIGTVPTALVLAQAANESAWGTSRFATEGNNLFGQWCFSLGCGLVPSGRPEGANYEVRQFKNPQDSVDAYIRNLNSHGGYIGLRRIRECLINNGQTVTARALSAGLISYSSRGVDYIDDIRSMIRVNKLEPWQKIWWGNGVQHPCSELVQLVRPKTATEDPIHGITTPGKY
ncbi:glucosaminidase domain-containing protein [Candidatus Njordibacter sp. Uisw_039]|jgi:Bax protein|uniref:glucosaminidase domain-containing protein n=1 Tax=Candidatus Njordibacter sp. Uisw_039 TaxID=3230972 RepID=UPI003A1C740F|tara:strand:- start:698 stop:1723 length:1026 start_codon:yes stop_codon:yes gene_type:complete